MRKDRIHTFAKCMSTKRKACKNLLHNPQILGGQIIPDYL